MTERADSMATTILITPDQLGYVCRCGQTHRAVEDYNHHNCLHDCDLWGIGRHQVVCSQCGASWRVIPGEEETG